MFNSAKDRFEAKFTVTPSCWIWNASLGTAGYGNFLFEGRPQPSSRVSYMLYVGSIPIGLSVLHTCDNRKCVNPSHLFLGTTNDNMSDMVMKNRQAKGESVAASKLNESQVIAIRKDGRSQRKIGNDYGISHTQVGSIKSNVYWKHV